MSYLTKLVKHLKEDEELKKLIEKRIDPLVIPEGGNTPCLTYQIINNKENKSIQGDMAYEKIRIQINCWAESYAKVKKLEGAVKNALESYAYEILSYSSKDSYERDTKLYGQLIDFTINT